MFPAPASSLKGVALAFAAFGLFATHDVVVKILGAHYSTFQIIFTNVLFSFPLVMFMLMRDRDAGTLLPAHPWWTALRTVAAMITGLSAFYAFSVLPLAQVYSLIFAMPLIITMLSVPVLGERVGPHRWAAVALGLVGVLIVLRPGSAAFTLGHMAALTAAFGGALASIIVRRIGRDERNAVLLLYPMMGNFVVMAGVMPFVYVPMPIEHLGLVAIMAICAFAAGLCLISAYKAADAAVVAPMQYSQIVWAALFGMVFFGEMVDQVTWIGAGVVIASGVYIVLRETFGGRTRERPVSRGRGRPETGTTPRAGTADMPSPPESASPLGRGASGAALVKPDATG